MSTGLETEHALPVVRHFWKAFATIVAFYCLYLLSTAISNSRSYRVKLETEDRKYDPALFDFIVKEQSGQASVFFKGESRSVTGFISGTNEGHLILETSLEGQPNIEGIVIPLDNILFVKYVAKRGDSKN